MAADRSRFWRWVAWSIGLHLAVLATFTVRGYWGKEEPMVFEDVMRVDLVALPDKSLAEAATAEAALPPAETPAPPPVETKSPLVEVKPPAEALEVPKKIDRNADALKKKALERLKAMQALDDLNRQEADEQKAKDEQLRQEKLKALAAVKSKGNAISPGTAMRGLSKLEYDNYLSALDKHIKSNWALPEWLARGGWRARVRVHFDTSGVITRRELVVKSGNPEFDERVLEAVDRSSPLPPPPEKFVDIVDVSGVIFGFPE
jgi:colicin import membrane protein